jgi:branched-subunit amino acid transport protein
MTFWSSAEAYAALAVGAVATYAWRALGAAIGARLDPESRAFVWLSCVAYAVLAALILRLIVFPAGGLAALPPHWRIGAALLAALAYVAARRSVAAGCFAGAAAIAAAAAWG